MLQIIILDIVMLSAIMLQIFILDIVMLSVIMVSVVMPWRQRLGLFFVSSANEEPWTHLETFNF